MTYYMLASQQDVFNGELVLSILFALIGFLFTNKKDERFQSAGFTQQVPVGVGSISQSSLENFYIKLLLLRTKVVCFVSLQRSMAFHFSWNYERITQLNLILSKCLIR